MIACHACDLVHRLVAVERKARVRCVRCRAELYRTSTASIDTALALAATALILLAVSNAYPLVALELNGVKRTTTLVGAANALYGQGYGPVAVLVLLTTLLIPLFQIAAMSYVLLPRRLGRHARGQNPLLRLLAHVRPWAMPEVFMLGALVALVKLAAMAEVVPGVALYSYGALMLALATLGSVAPSEQVWRWVGDAR